MAAVAAVAWWQWGEEDRYAMPGEQSSLIIPCAKNIKAGTSIVRLDRKYPFANRAKYHNSVPIPATPPHVIDRDCNLFAAQINKLRIGI